MSGESDAQNRQTVVSFLKSQKRFLLVLGILTLLIRGGVLIALNDRLNDDIDAYLAIAEEIAAGNGFSGPGGSAPTAYRPPLYPFLLAVALWGPGTWGIAVLHLVLGLGTVLLTWRLGSRLGFETAGRWAAVLIAFDPLLVQYSAQPMTETLCAFLAVLALFLMVPMPASFRQGILLGVVLGLCILSRPTFLAFAGLAFVVWVFRFRRVVEVMGFALLGMLLTVSPWMIRNAIVFGEPRIATTHGGYTLLLGNNSVFYREVVEAPLGTTWDGESLGRWQASLEQEMKALGLETEPERDRYLARKARRHIAENPGLFLRACGLRFLRFWNVFPPETALGAVKTLWNNTCRTLGLPWESAANAISQAVRWSVVLFYALVLGSFMMGLARLEREEWSRWWPLVLLIFCFCAVHLVYWSNTRMRAPVMPAVVCLAVRAWIRHPPKQFEQANKTFPAKA